VTVVTLATQPVSLTTELPGRTSPFRVAEVRPQALARRGATFIEIGNAIYE
ncbi:efflux transporter periplasmic adaptor subunit, partial [Methylobacterium radiotolerans]